MLNIENIGVQTRVQTAIEMKEIAEPFIRRRAVRHLEKGRVVIFGAGSGNPYFSTDTAAALRAAEMEAEIILLAKKVDGVYDKDPVRFSDAKKFNTLRLQQAVERPDIKVMDKASIALAADYKLPLVVCKLLQEDNLVRAASGEHVGTRISAE